MHRVLQIPEVLLNIFCYLAPPGLSEEDRIIVDSDLVALARTCRAFKEPALDVLWSELNDPNPLIWCLPGVSTTTHVARRPFTRDRKIYSLTRPLERAEWDILRSYARRVWYLCDVQMELEWKSVKTSMALTPADPLFPSLRSLHCKFTEEIIPLLLMPLPSLIRLDIDLTSDVDPCMLQEPLQSLAKTSLNIKRLDIAGGYQCFTKIVSDGICGWSNLQTLACPEILLDVRTLVHLSRMPSLARLTLMLSDAFPDWTSPSPSGSFSFSALNYLKLHAKSLAPISRLLSWTQLPAITDFTVVIDSCPSKQDFSSFMAGIQMAGMGQTIEEIKLNQRHFPEDKKPGADAPLLELDDLWPCMAFHHLRRMNVDLEWNVGLSDSQLLTLESAWPRLEELLINMHWGWNTPGITPNGLALLLETCPALTSIALAIDTRGYIRLPARRYRETLSSSTFERPFSINVVDSAIERESVAALVAFFPSIVPHFHFILTTWHGWSVLDSQYPDWDPHPYRARWEAVYSEASEVIRKRWLNVLRRVLFQS